MKLRAKNYDTKFTNTMTPVAVQDEQHIQLTATKLPDKQSIEITNWRIQEPEFEIQELLIRIESSTSVPATNLFRLGLYGVFTGIY